MIYCACGDGTIKILDINTGNIQQAFQHQGVFWIQSVNHGGQEILIAVGFDKCLRIWPTNIGYFNQTNIS